MTLRSFFGMTALGLMVACGDDAGGGAGGGPSSGGGGSGAGGAPTGGGGSATDGGGGAAEAGGGQGGIAAGGAGTGGDGTGGAPVACITCFTAFLDPTATQGAAFCDGSAPLYDDWVACTCTPGSQTCGDGNECDSDATCPPPWPPKTPQCGNCVAQNCEAEYDACVADM